MLPKVRPSSGVFGETRALGSIPAGVPVSGVAGDQQAALRTAQDAEVSRRGDLASDEVLGNRDQIVEVVLVFLPHRRLVPLGPELAAATDVGQHVNPAALDPEEGVALEAGLFLHPDPPGPIVHALFSAIVIMAIVTTVAMPIALRLLWKK